MSESPPLEPFTPAEEHFATMHEIYQNMQRGGFDKIEALIFLAATLMVNGKANPTSQQQH